MANSRGKLRLVVAVAILPAIPTGPALAATPGPDCTVREVIVTETRNLDPRYRGTLGRVTPDRPAATVRQQPVWKTPLVAIPPATTGG